MVITRYDKLPRIGRSTPARRYKGVTLPLRGGTGTRQVTLVSPEEAELAQRIGQERAQRILRLRGKGIIGTVPELATYDWLENRGFSFEFQSSMLGGQYMHGGAVVDFLVADISRMGWYVWRVQGQYWHQGLEVGVKDESQKARLRRAWIKGIPVVEVVDLYERRILDDYPDVFEKAEAGVELGE